MTDFERARQHFLVALEKQQAACFSEAEALYRAADALLPGRVSVMTNLAAVLIEQGAYAEAGRWCEKVLAAEPGNPDALLNLSLCRNEGGNAAEARALLDRLLENCPTHVGALCNRAALARLDGRLDAAAEDYSRALQCAPERDDAHALAGMGMILLQRGLPREALSCFKRALRIDPRATEAGDGLVLALRSGDLAAADFDEEIEQLALQLFRAACMRPESVRHVLIGRLRSRAAYRPVFERVRSAWPERLGLEALQWEESSLRHDPLLLALLETAPIPDEEIERLLVSVRYRLLQRALQGGRPADLGFHCALARQCFINEYVYPLSAGERDEVGRLRDRIEEALRGGKTLPDAWLVAAATYLPLSALENAAALLAGPPRCAEVAAVLLQQVREPMQELSLRQEIERLTPVDDEVSQRVREQYEENPYPRWTQFAAASRRTSYAAWLAARLGKAAGHGHSGRPVEALTAGCGTGRQSIETASQIADLDLLAVDLSLSSLAFSLRKAREAAVTGLRFAQADILRLRGLDRRFDFIESTGVLHHMREPSAGLAVLAGLLKETGMIRLAFYSEAARRSVVAVRNWIARANIAADADGIRDCRQRILALAEDACERSVARFADFYSMSECRDLLFHVEEHRYTLAGIGRLLAGAGLRLVGFELEPWQLARFRKDYPDEASLSNLDHWHEFELRNPDFFASMYHFWACRQS